MGAGIQDTFGERLRRHRETAGLSQERLAERAGMSANAVGALERGERTRPYPDTVRRLADALGLDDAARAGLADTLRDGSQVAAPRLGAAHDRNELPREPTPLIGRDDEIDELRRLLRGDARVLTLIGPGGAGKTRLALRLAHLVADEYPHGVTWVELAPLADAALVTATIVRALGLDASGPEAAEAALRSWLRDRRSLLVLDNVEHVLDAIPGLLRLLDGCPGIRLLATSRSPLGVRGEREFTVPPLAVPPADPRAIHRDPGDYAAVRLFVWQARQRDPE
ncbi:MAG: helix-turn-helix domain-containing protein, partial [Gemmatimonadota bacterium]|nr:helix-turn-helix domain-containing protein [Gemmatimonadota bacterium]